MIVKKEKYTILPKEITVNIRKTKVLYNFKKYIKYLMKFSKFSFKSNKIVSIKKCSFYKKIIPLLNLSSFTLFSFSNGPNVSWMRIFQEVHATINKSTTSMCLWFLQQLISQSNNSAHSDGRLMWYKKNSTYYIKYIYFSLIFSYKIKIIPIF